MTSSVLGNDSETKQRVELPKSSRLQGLYVIGANGTGKSGLLENLIIQDINQNIGCAVLDPHGDLIDKILSRIKAEDEDKIIYLDVLNKHYAFGLNLYECSDPSDPEKVVRTFEQVEHVFELLWGRDIEIATRPDLSQAIRNTAYSLIYNSDTEYSGNGLLELPLLFEEEIPRQNIQAVLKDRSERLSSYWNRFTGLSPTRQEYFSQMLVSRAERFILNEFVRSIVGQSRTTINFREVMDQGKILLVKLPGQFEDTTELLGSMIIAEILSAALSRSDTQRRRQFNIYADEFQKFASTDFSKLLTECRKYGQAVTIAHQARDFIDLKNKAAALQAANITVFRVIPKDAHELAGSFDCSPIPGQPRKEYKRTPVGDLIEQIVGGRRHPKQIVNDFCMKFEKLIPYAHSIPREAEKDTLDTRTGPRGTTSIYKQGRYEGNEYLVNGATKVLNQWDDFFYQIMLARDAHIIECWGLFNLAGFLELPFNPWPTYKNKTPINYGDLLWKREVNHDKELHIFLFGLLIRDSDDELPILFSEYQKFNRARLKELNLDESISATMQPSFEAFVLEVRAVAKALAEQPVLSSSGVEEEVTDEIPSHEVQNRIANQLSRLEKHTARVRIHGMSDTLEEYLIETEKPGNGIHDKALEERKERILHAMISQGIYRSKQEIDEEIKQRHVRLRQPEIKKEQNTDKTLKRPRRIE